MADPATAPRLAQISGVIPSKGFMRFTTKEATPTFIAKETMVTKINFVNSVPPLAFSLDSKDQCLFQK